MALQLDKETKKRPLHGIPISIKENYYIKVSGCVFENKV